MLRFVRVYILTFVAAVVADLYIYGIKPIIMPGAHTLGDYLRTLLGGRFELNMSHKFHGPSTVSEAIGITPMASSTSSAKGAQAVHAV